ncbi:MAG: hypothetical protein WC612_04455 [Bdellovibrionales bacterium]|jgi:hypothetical protein
MVQKIVKATLVILIVGVIALVGFRALNMRDQRTTGQRMGDAVDAVSDGVDNAGRQLKNRTPGEKLGDAVKDVGDDIKEKSAP